MLQEQRGGVLFAVPVRVLRSDGRKVQQTIAYLWARDETDAIERLEHWFSAETRTRLEVTGTMVRMDGEHWDIYVEATWPEFKRALPSQEELTSVVGCRQVYLVPEFDDRF
jgi:hypothetical protein